MTMTKRVSSVFPDERVVRWMCMLSLLLTVAAPAHAKKEPPPSSFTACDCCLDSNAAAAAADRVTFLPGWNQPLPSPWFSGFLSYEFEDETVHTHYTLVLAEDSFSPANNNNDNEDDEKPLIYWSNGGPGASSLFGLLTELGPLMLDDRSLATDEYRATGIPTPQYNPSAWTRLGSILTFDQPAPVGFSYCGSIRNANATNCGDITWTDELASLNAFLALQAFYQKFPCLQRKPLYLTGESYGGIYIPTLARRILEYNNNTQTHTQSQREEKEKVEDDDNNNDNNDDDDAPVPPPRRIIPLQGFAVGDGCLGTHSGICSDLSDTDPGFGDVLFHALFMAGHGQIPLSTYHTIVTKCYGNGNGDSNNNKEQSNGEQDASSSSSSLSSEASLLRQQRRVLNINQQEAAAEKPLLNKRSPECQAAIDLAQKQVGGYFEYSLYDDCIYENGFLQRMQLIQARNQQQSLYPMMPLTGALNDYACGGGVVMEQWLKLPSVKQALHVENATFFSVDNAQGGFRYTPTEKDLRGFYYNLVTNPNVNVRVLIYNGDTDPAITSFAAQNWTSNLGLIETEGWRPWTIDQCRRIGGYVTRYQGNFDFLTIRGAGHMVPTYKPAATFAFMNSWITNKNYPIFDKTCVKPPVERETTKQISPAVF